MSAEAIQSVGVNVQEKSNVVWNVANILAGPFKPHEYGLVVLPMAVIKRFHDCLIPTRNNVFEVYQSVKDFEVKDGFLCEASGYQFYNTSNFTFSLLIADPENIEENFKAYTRGFSENVQDILTNFEFDRAVKRMVDNGLLYHVVKEFTTEKAYMGPDVISAVDMGYIFEDLIKKFSESYNEDAGAHFTSRDIIYLMTDCLLATEKSTLAQDGVVKTVYDMAMGTSQMISCMDERLHELDADAEVTGFGQEINPVTFAIAKADTLIKGGDPENMKQGDTLDDDKFKGFRFDFVISNPPFGIDWKKEEKKVKAEADQGDAGRFGAGLPSISDGQMLFLLNGINKMKDMGRMAIIQNGSSMFSGDAGSGPSEIRRYIIENDWLDSIIQLSNDAFYNTGITTYIWVLDKDKPLNRMGKVQLIDASKCFEKRRKCIGSKRNDITDKCREMIVRAYGNFLCKSYGSEDAIFCESKIFDVADFGYNKITVERPVRDLDDKITFKGKKKPVADPLLRDSERVPLSEDIDAYFEREVIPYVPDAWIDKSKTKVGYEILFTRYFYKYRAPENSELIANRIKHLEAEIAEAFMKLSEKES